MTKLNGDSVIRVGGKVEENQVESWPIKDDWHDLVKFRLPAYVHDVASCSFLDTLDSV